MSSCPNLLEAAALNVLADTIETQNGFVLPVCISKSSQLFRLIVAILIAVAAIFGWLSTLILRQVIIQLLIRVQVLLLGRHQMCLRSRPHEGGLVCIGVMAHGWCHGAWCEAFDDDMPKKFKEEDGLSSARKN